VGQSAYVVDNGNNDNNYCRDRPTQCLQTTLVEFIFRL